MTDPGVQISAQVAIAVDVQMLNGQWCVVLQTGLGPLACSLWMLPDNAREYAHSIQGALNHAAEKADRKNTGLVLPGE